MTIQTAWRWAADNQQWIIEIFIVVILTTLLSVMARYLMDTLAKHARKSKNLWDDALLVAARRPAQLAIWGYGLLFAGHIVDLQSKSMVFQVLEPVGNIGIVILLGWFLVQFIREVESNLTCRADGAQKLDATTVHAVGKLLRASVIITMGLVALQTLGFSVSGILAFGGIGGLAIGLAAKDLLANFFGGLMLYLDRPFVIGDWIRSPDRNIEGTVEYIGWRLTRIRTFDKRPLYVPNSAFANISVENPSRMENRRIYETIGIRYDDIHKMGIIVEDVKKMLQSHSDIATDKTLMVYFNAYSASSVDFFVYAFTKTTDWAAFHGIKHDVLLKISHIIESHQAQIAFPTSTVHLVSNENPLN